MQIEVIKRSRLNGRDVEPGEVIELDAGLAAAWFRGGRARQMSIPGKPPKAEIQLKALDVYNLELLVEQSVKTLQHLALRHGIVAPKKAGKQKLIDLLMDAKASEGPPEEKQEEPKAIELHTREELGELTMKNLLELARLNGIETPREISKQDLIDLFVERREAKGSEKEPGGEETQVTTKPKEEGLLDMSMKKLLQLARLKGIKVTRKTGRKQLIDLLIKAKEDEGEGESDEETEGKPEETGEPEGENPASSD